eukprot:7662082-Pyramimonas_sp.AAC.1
MGPDICTGAQGGGHGRSHKGCKGMRKCVFHATWTNNGTRFFKSSLGTDAASNSAPPIRARCNINQPSTTSIPNGEIN